MVTLREHLEAIRDLNVWGGSEPEIRNCHCMVDVVETHGHAAAALAILDVADREVLPRGKENDPGATRWYGACRLVPDPQPPIPPGDLRDAGTRLWTRDA